MQELTQDLLDAGLNRSLEHIQWGTLEYDPDAEVTAWDTLQGVEEYSIGEEQDLIQNISLTLAAPEEVDLETDFPTNGIFRLYSRFGSDIHVGENHLLGTFLLDSIEAGPEQNFSLQGRSTLKLATLRPYTGSHKRAKAYINETIETTNNYWELLQIDPGASYEYYIFVLGNPYFDPSDTYLTNYGDIDYVKSWCESPTFPIYIDTSGGGANPSETDRVYPGETFEIIYALGQIRANKTWWDASHSGDSFYVGTFDYDSPTDPNVDGAGSLNWYKGECQALTEDYTETKYGVPVMESGWGWHDPTYVANVARLILKDCGFQEDDPTLPFYLQQLGYTYLLTNCEYIYSYNSDFSWTNYSSSSTIPMSGAGICEYLYVGATERFRQIYLTPHATQDPPFDYQMVWQYYNETDGWVTMEVIEDETDGGLVAGRIRFEYQGMEEFHATTVNSIKAFWIRTLASPNNNYAFSRAGYWANINLVYDAQAPDLVLTDRDRVTHLEALQNHVFPYLPPNWKLHNEPDGSLRSYLVKEKSLADYELTHLERLNLEKNDREVWTTIHYYGRGHFIPNRLALKDRESGDTATLSAPHTGHISWGAWNDAYNDDLRDTSGVEFDFVDMSHVRTLHASFTFSPPLSLGENARFSMIGRRGIGRWSLVVLDYDTGNYVFLNDDAHDFPVEVDEVKTIEGNFNAQTISAFYIWLWGYNGADPHTGYREMGLWGTDLLKGEAILGTTPPFDSSDDQDMMAKLHDRIWQNEEVDDQANTQTVVDYRALQMLSYFQRHIQTLQVDAIRPGIKLHDTVRVRFPRLGLDDTFLVESLTRNPHSIVSAKLTSYRTDIQQP